MKSERPLTELEEERAVPWGDPGIFAWHRARYEFATPLATAGDVLDVGCGEGYGAALLAERATTVLGVDYSPAAIDHARQTYRRPNLRFEVMDVTSERLGHAHFDLITCFEVVEHIENDAPVFASMARLLKPGGRLVVSTPNGLVESLFDQIGERGHYEYHVNVLTPRELARRLRPHFRNVRLYGQWMAGNRLHTALKGLDVLNLRHRLIRSHTAQRALAQGPLGRGDATRLESHHIRFSRRMVRQASAIVAIAER